MKNTKNQTHHSEDVFATRQSIAETIDRLTAKTLM